MSDEAEVTRIDPANAVRWFVSAGWARHTLVVATTKDEARCIAACYFARRAGRTHMQVPLPREFRARPATERDVETFLSLLAQDRAGPVRQPNPEEATP